MTPILIHNLPPERWKHFQYNSNSHYHHHYHLHHHHHPHSCLITGDKASSSVSKYGHLSQELGILVQHWTHIFSWDLLAYSTITQGLLYLLYFMVAPIAIGNSSRWDAQMNGRCQQIVQYSNLHNKGGMQIHQFHFGNKTRDSKRLNSGEFPMRFRSIPRLNSA